MGWFVEVGWVREQQEGEKEGPGFSEKQTCLVGLVAGQRAEHGLRGAFGRIHVGAKCRGVVVVAGHAGGDVFAGVAGKLLLCSWK